MKKIITAMFVCFVILCTLSSCDINGKTPENNISTDVTSSEGAYQNRKAKISDSHNLTIEDKNKNVLITNSDVDFVECSYSDMNGYFIQLTFTSQGADKFAEVTKNNLGYQLFIKIDGETVSEPTISAEITDGVAVITGLDREEALSIYDRLT